MDISTLSSALPQGRTAPTAPTALHRTNEHLSRWPLAYCAVLCLCAATTALSTPSKTCISLAMDRHPSNLGNVKTILALYPANRLVLYSTVHPILARAAAGAIIVAGTGR